MRKTAIIATLGLVAMGLSACASGGISNRSRPDEFAVARHAPLVVPPDFALVPPRPGEPRAQEADASTQALQAMFGGTAQRSGTETGVLAAAGRANADTSIRSEVGDPETKVVDKGAITRDVLAAPEGDGQEARASTPQ